MFEVTMAHLEGIAAEQIVIATALVAKASAETVATLGADSPDLAAATAALIAANAAAAAEGVALGVLEGARATITAAALTVGGIGAASAGTNAVLITTVAGTA